MHVRALSLRQFRNYASLDIDFLPGINVLYGANAQGKTNLLEAIYFLGTGRSHRTPRDADLLRDGQDTLVAAAQVERRTGTLSVELTLSPGARKRLKINGTPEAKIARLVGRLSVVLFAPDDLQLVKGSPAQRRRFLDIEISQLSSTYLHYLQTYNRVLQQRNAILRQPPSATLKGTLDILDEQLTDVGAQLVTRRWAAVQQLAALARTMHSALTAGQEELAVTYQSRILQRAAATDYEAVRAAMAGLLEAARATEQWRGVTLVGPHRDDLFLAINQRDARIYASQGQQRTAVLALKMAELQFMRQEIGEAPVLLLDDVASELDPRRRNFLLSAVEHGVQTFLTCTDLADINPSRWQTEATVYRIENGRITFSRRP